MILPEAYFIAQKAYCHEQIEYLSLAIDKFPPGSLRCYKNGRGYRNLLLLNKGRRVIPRTNDGFARLMARKAVFEARRTDCEAELEFCEKSIVELKRQPHKMEKLLSNQGICGLLSQDNPEADIQAWIDGPYNSNPLYPENLIHNTTAGIKVRSKSEVLCVTALQNLGLPFRYEQELKVGDKTYYPDFVVMHPVTRKLYIIELFGMMGDKEYAGRCAEKLSNYIANGYIPQDNLICFFESLSNPLSVTFVQSMLEQLILQR